MSAAMKRKRDESPDSDSEDVDSNDSDALSDDHAYQVMCKERSKNRVRTLQATSKARNEEAVSFLAFPAELKNRIYQIMFPTENSDVTLQHIKQDDRHSVTPVKGDNPEAWLEILTVCKQTYSEALGYLYSGKGFFLADATTAFHFLAQIGPHGRERITQIYVKEWDPAENNSVTRAAALTLMAGCPNLLRLNLTYRPSERTPEDYARSLYSEGEHFFAAYGAVHGKKDAAMDILDIYGRWPNDEYDRTERENAMGIFGKRSNDYHDLQIVHSKSIIFETELRRLISR